MQVEVIHEKKANDSTAKVKATCGKLEVTECLFNSKSAKPDFSKTSIPKLPQYSVVSKPNCHSDLDIEIEVSYGCQQMRELSKSHQNLCVGSIHLSGIQYQKLSWSIGNENRVNFSVIFFVL